MVEIRDALLALQPYVDPVRRAAAHEVAASAAIEERERRLLADACWVEIARHAKLAGGEPGSAPAREIEDGTAPVWGQLDDLDTEARLLTRLERARRSTTVRRFVHTHAPQERITS